MSRPQVTITLGHTGQVVKRTSGSGETFRSDYGSVSGSKRSVRDRLGNGGDQPYNNKRQKHQGNRSLADGTQVNKDDLRFKLLRKKELSMDLREKLSRTVLPPLRVDPRERERDPKETGPIRRMPPARSQDDFEMESYRKSYAAWNLDGLRRRSPDRLVSTSRSRGVSPPRVIEVRRQVRPVEASRPSHMMNRDVISVPGPTTLVRKPTLPVEGAKPVLRLAPQTASGVVQKSPYMGEQPVTVASLLQTLGLSKYSIMFQAEEVDMPALRQMGDSDLKELGIPMGPRKKILLAIAPRVRRHPPM
ncbi:uncharacterized protein LOC113276366 isoform X2 [Papaver somniferum]|uniref:uncharacterized protein LOC113276366 isoform X2 n=1 Tax=Papaver somniferum TaxID=3469 RepID=UPI000E705751|nr:uncharacterized protein LOC113276366 isoform X2 [Papaver somniferum]